MRFLRLVIVCSILFSAVPLCAAEMVGVRSGAHDGYSRLVFQWSGKPDYSLSKESGQILIRFGKAGEIDLSSLGKNDPNIRKVTMVSKAGEPLQVAVDIPAGSRFRDFTVENRLIVDVYDPKDQKPDDLETDIKDKKEQPVSKGDFSLVPAHSEEAAPIVPVEVKKVPSPAFDPHVVTMTSTTGFGVAAFERNGSLWIVTDSPDLSSAPQLAGPQKDQLPPIEKMDVEGLNLYRMNLPEGIRAYGEGGGIGWRIILTSKEQPAKPVAPQSDRTAGSSKLVWPLKGMKKILSFKDPELGDTLTVVTASDASQFAGQKRNFVNLRTLDSVIGLTFISKSDDVKAALREDQVIVERPGGLSLLKESSVAPAEIKNQVNGDAKKKPEEKPSEEALKKSTDAKPVEPQSPDTKTDTPAPSEIAKVAHEKPSGKNIYNFDRWEMGGISSLEKNQHVMMVEASGKKEEDRTEDIVTMAKLNLANHRGVEALGLLDIALQKVPELESNPEFLALRGAARAIANMYDDAIVDLSNDSLKTFDDIKYWRAYTLAGLEDWKQAFEVMPEDFSSVASYPKSIRIPMILTFAEIALRGGQQAMAEDILDILEPDLPKLSLPYASSWKYLTGEAQRQAGHPEKAIEYWEPLVKRGKDDLFRAKAGLSLTKLEQDTKKINTKDAINRLEGLRYAWRGDELETLVNYRLGQVYIDNKDYLKGLTVLRNASTLFPDSAMGKEITAYMNKSFREIFTKDRLKTMSPLEAISLYEDFKELLPPGGEGNEFVEKLAERLVGADLLGRASSLLEYQVNHRLQGDKKVEIAIRLAAIRLLDNNPDGTLRSLEIAQDTIDKMAKGVSTVPVPEKKDDDAETPAPVVVSTGQAGTPDPEKQRQIYLLKARALSLKKKIDEAMAILESMPLDSDVNKLRTDIAWTAGRWDMAAAALNDLVTAEDISAKAVLSNYQKDIIFNRAIALNLSGDRVGLANLRERYNEQMKPTDKGTMFEVVTRPRKPDMIGSREAIQAMISEIDLFKGFVDAYAKMEGDKKSPDTKNSVPETPSTPPQSP